MELNQPTIVNLTDIFEKYPFYRDVIYTGKFQITTMTLNPGEEIGWEQHSVDQMILVKSGKASFMLSDENNEELSVQNDILIIPSGMRHNVKNIGNENLNLLSVYSSPLHPYGKVTLTKMEENH